MNLATAKAQFTILPNGSLSHNPTGGYALYPLLQVAGTTELINPYNSAVYTSRDEATGAVGGFQVILVDGASTDVIVPAANGGLVSVSAPAPFLGGVLDGEIFGINKKILAVGVIAYFVFSKN